MANNNSYEKFCLVNKRKLKDLETNLECSVNLESTEAVNKILAVNVDGDVGQIEALTGEASVSGNMLVSIVYATENGLVGDATFTAPFITKAVDTQIKPESKVFVKISSIDAKVRSLSNNVAKVDMQARLKVFCANNEEVEYLSSSSSDVCTLTELTSFTELSGVTKSAWTENMEVEIKEPVNKVLSSSCDVSVKDVECGAGFVSVSCEVVNKLMYLTDEETPQIKTVYTKTDVKQEVESEFATTESKVDLDLMIVKNDVKNNLSDKDDNIKIAIEIPLDVCIRVYSENNINLITDLYSTQSYTNVTTESYENSVPKETIRFEKKVEGSLTLSEDEPRIDKLLAVNYSKAIVTNEYLDNGEYSVSGIITSNLIYFNEDDNMVNSVDVEVPFVVTCQTELEGEILTDLEVMVKDVDVMVKKGRDVFVDATVVVNTSVSKVVRGAIIKELNFVEKVPDKDCAIEIYFAKAGEKVWDIAKRLFIKPENIYLQNPNVGEVLENDEKLAIYYQKTQN